MNFSQLIGLTSQNLYEKTIRSPTAFSVKDGSNTLAGRYKTASPYCLRIALTPLVIKIYLTLRQPRRQETTAGYGSPPSRLSQKSNPPGRHPRVEALFNTLEDGNALRSGSPPSWYFRFSRQSY